MSVICNAGKGILEESDQLNSLAAEPYEPSRALQSMWLCQAAEASAKAREQSPLYDSKTAAGINLQPVLLSQHSMATLKHGEPDNPNNEVLLS